MLKTHNLFTGSVVIDFETGMPPIEMAAERLGLFCDGFDAVVATVVVAGTVDIHLKILDVGKMPWLRRETRDRWVVRLRRLMP